MVLRHSTLPVSTVGPTPGMVIIRARRQHRGLEHVGLEELGLVAAERLHTRAAYRGVRLCEQLDLGSVLEHEPRLARLALDERLEQRPSEQPPQVRVHAA